MADINPSSLVYNGATVDGTNPLPCHDFAGASSPGPDGTITLNPKSLVVNGAPVTSANPLPIVLV